MLILLCNYLRVKMIYDKFQDNIFQYRERGKEKKIKETIMDVNIFSLTIRHGYADEIPL